VPEVVKTDAVGETSAPKKRFERAGEVAVAQRRAHLRGEHKILVLIKGVCFNHFPGLPLAVAFKGFYGGRGEVYAPTALGGFGGVNVPLESVRRICSVPTSRGRRLPTSGLTGHPA
jgi:hypothetical protein